MLPARSARGTAAGLLLAAILGCQGPGPGAPATDLVGGDGRYAVHIDPGASWRIERGAAGSDQLTLIQRVDRPIRIVSFRRVAVEPARPGENASDVALDFMRREREVMVQEGVHRNEYLLGPIERDFVRIGGRDFFRMGYEVRTTRAVNRASLLLYVDSWDRPRELLVIWAGVADRGGVELDDPLSYPEIRQVIGSLDTPPSRQPAASEALATVMATRERDRREIVTLGAFDPSHRVEIYRVVGGLASDLNRQFPYQVLARIPEPGAAAQLGRVELVDRNMDGVADEYAIRAVDGSETPDYGFLFDLDRNGRFDCVASEDGGWLSIDSNDDGVEDARALAADLDRDGEPDPQVAAWLLDVDFDGRFDEAEYLGPSVHRPIPLTGNHFEIRTPAGIQKVGRKAERGPFFVKTDLSELGEAPEAAGPPSGPPLS